MEVTCGGIAGLRAPVARTPCGPVGVAPTTFSKRRLLVCTDRLTLAAVAARLLAVVVQCAAADTAIVVGEQLCFSVTAPWCLLNAIGMVTALPDDGVRVMRPKY